jgi:uncharacterized RDD family membrane protein YckC
VRLDDRVTVATPEGVTIELVLAGLGSRFVARLLDTLIQLLIIIALAWGVGVTHAHGAPVAFALVAIFLVMLVYDVPFEVLNNGRTIGKLAAGIRVVEMSGEPISLLGSLIRNLLRLVDFLPLFYVVGSISIVSTGRDQRLGDLAAGSVVARDRFVSAVNPLLAPLTVPAEAVAMWDVSAVDGQDLATIRHFLDRRLSLPWPVRMYFANAISARVGPHIAGLPANAHPEYVLEGIVVAKQRRA